MDTQREMKFRAWDKDLKEMLFIDNIFNMTEKFSERGKLGYFILQQFTGLKDKNGKEIYEGDILNNGDKDGNWVVTSDKDNCFYVLCEALGDLCESRPAITGHLKVIGNIFENPELIK